MFVIIHEADKIASVHKEKSQVARLIGCSSRTISNNMEKMPYKKNGYTVYLAPEGVEKSRRGGNFRI